MQKTAEAHSGQNGRDRRGDASLAVRAAWLHYGAGMTQAEVAKRLGISSLKAHRLIARANRDGIVHVSIDGEIEECVRLEEALSRRYGLAHCEVAPDIDPEPLPLRTLGMIGARFLRLELERGETSVIGVGHGRTLAACVAQLPRIPAPSTRFVSLLGGLTRRYAATPYDVIHRLAERTGAEAFVLPVPFFANTAEDRAIMLAQKGIAEVFELGRAATLRFVGIGNVEPDASVISSGMLETAEYEALKRAGAVGEVLGHFFDAEGRVLETVVSGRAISMSLEDIAARRTVAVAGGRGKVAAIRAVLTSGLLQGLLTDEVTARELLR